jgi:hypothetical protein
MEKSNIYIKRGFDSKSGSLRYMGMFTEQIIDGLHGSDMLDGHIEKFKHIVLTDGAVCRMLTPLVKYSTLKNTYK